jgi:hypothetical protein
MDTKNTKYGICTLKNKCPVGVPFAGFKSKGRCACIGCPFFKLPNNIKYS